MYAILVYSTIIITVFVKIYILICVQKVGQEIKMPNLSPKYWVDKN